MHDRAQKIRATVKDDAQAIIDSGKSPERQNEAAEQLLSRLTDEEKSILEQSYVLIIKRMLRHKSIQNTMKYIHTIEFKEEDFEETVATTPEEIRQLGKAGWAKYDEITVNGTQMHF